MDDSILPKVRSTLRSKRRLDRLYSRVFIYQKGFTGLPLGNRKVVVGVKFEFDPLDVTKENNFVLSAYLRR